MTNGRKTTIALGDIVARKDVKTRSVQGAWVESLVEVIETNTPFDDDIHVFTDGETHWLAVGFHRHAAYKKAGRSEVPCKLFQGTLQDAKDYARKDHNAGHRGRPETQSERRNRVKSYTADHMGDTQRAIAEHCGVGHNTVKRIKDEIKSELVPDGTSDANPSQPATPQQDTPTAHDHAGHDKGNVAKATPKRVTKHSSITDRAVACRTHIQNGTKKDAAVRLCHLANGKEYNRTCRVVDVGGDALVKAVNGGELPLHTAYRLAIAGTTNGEVEAAITAVRAKSAKTVHNFKATSKGQLEDLIAAFASIHASISGIQTNLDIQKVVSGGAISRRDELRRLIAQTAPPFDDVVSRISKELG